MNCSKCIFRRREFFYYACNLRKNHSGCMFILLFIEERCSHWSTMLIINYLIGSVILFCKEGISLTFKL
jgi:hypothetical protein